MLPLTHAVPKELLPLDGRPIIEHVVDELLGAGIERVWLVTRPGKRAIEEHFDRHQRVEIVRQCEPRGLGDAVLCAEAAVGDRPFLVANGDSVFRTPAVAEALLAVDGTAVAVERVAPERLSHYGVVAVEDERVVDVVEKPAPGTAPSDLAIAGRYRLGPEIFGALRACRPATGELGLTEALVALIAAGERVTAVPVGEPRYDIGNLDAYAAAFVEFALARAPGGR
jgi:UTP--glucose-1-phosphate uridylyltransferase